jgi:DNA-directed RNA polymerase subunit omega
MARITIEDCIEQVPNRFKLIQMAAIRAKQLKKGANPLVDSEENKAVVTALREIAAGVVKPDMSLVQLEADLAESLPGLGSSEPAAESEEATES